jgi:hypothetical protein
VKRINRDFFCEALLHAYYFHSGTGTRNILAEAFGPRRKNRVVLSPNYEGWVQSTFHTFIGCEKSWIEEATPAFTLFLMNFFNKFLGLSHIKVILICLITVFRKN